MKAGERLQQILQSGKIPHALLLTGPENSAKKEAALHFALTLLRTQKKAENHPDLHQYFPEGKISLHPIESIRNLAHEVSLAPFEAPYKLFILHEAEKMLPTSSNALLKTLEEPASHTIILLLTAYSDRLLPTITSRCQTIDFPLAQRPTDPAILAILSGAAPRDFTTLETDHPDILFETILFWYRDRLLLELGGSHLHFPQQLAQLQKTPLIPLETVEKQIALVRLAHSRSTKLSTCLDMLFLAMEQGILF